MTPEEIEQEKIQIKKKFIDEYNAALQTETAVLANTLGRFFSGERLKNLDDLAYRVLLLANINNLEGYKGLKFYKIVKPNSNPNM